MIYVVNMQVSCDVDDAYAVQRHARNMLASRVFGPDADHWINEYTKTTEHCLSVILGSPEAAAALRAVGAAVDGMDIIGQGVPVDQIVAEPFDSD